MGLNCGIVGLPNVGKSTLFQALTSSVVEASNYPFCTIDPNVGIVNIPDPRLKKLADIIRPKKILPSVIEFVDIAGLVKGASKGEGLGNQFLGHIRQVGAIIHVVRCFDDDDITHVHGKIDPIGDIETIHLELALSDLETVTKRLSQLDKMKRSQDREVAKKAVSLAPLLKTMANHLEEGKLLSTLDLEESEKELVSDLHFLTLKKQLYLCNVDEDSLNEDNAYVKKVREFAAGTGSEVLVICGKIEAEISVLEDEEEKQAFLEDLNIEESGLDRLIRSGQKMLGIGTYFTAGEQEVRSWTFREGMKAPETAGIIHTDFQRGFIKAEIYHCEDIFALGAEAKLRPEGKIRLEGKEYIVKDGDVIHFKFNV